MEKIKLHMGCGSNILKGYINIDINNPKADLNSDCTNLPYKDNSVDVIESYHMIEHVTPQMAKNIIKESKRVLKPGGIFIIECPNVLEGMRDFIANEDIEVLYSIYGRHRRPYDSHLWGYTPKTMVALLTKLGFINATSKPPQDYHKESEPCMRVEAKA